MRPPIRTINFNMTGKPFALSLWISALIFYCSAAGHAAPVNGWLNWRGPHQNSVSNETDLPSAWTPGGENDLWAYPLMSRGAVVTAGERAYVWGYEGAGFNVVEVLACLDLRTGKKIWDLRFPDFISDAIYNRYSIGSPVVDAETGNLYLLTTPGLMLCIDPDGEILWKHSMLEEFGRLTFPNGRTGSPVIVGNLVIHHAIISSWGALGPARDRFFAFDKKTGDFVWINTPGVGPKDSSFSTPLLATYGGMHVLYAGTGCGNLVCMNALDGRELWRYQMSSGGVNGSPVQFNDMIVELHGNENIDKSTTGRMIALPAWPKAMQGATGQVVVKAEEEAWRNDALSMFTSSPVLHEGVVYQMTAVGDLFAVDAQTGKTNWTLKLDNAQLHSTPLVADGKLYVLLESGLFYIIEPTATEGKILHKVQLDGNGIGSPTVWRGHIFVPTTKQLYCFGKPKGKDYTIAYPELPKLTPGPATGLLAVPNEVLLKPGERKQIHVAAVDAAGNKLRDFTEAQWEKFIPPTARVKAEMDAGFEGDSMIVAQQDAKISAGAFRATVGELHGTMRGRVLPDLPYTEDFDDFELAESDASGAAWDYPPLPWIGARFKWDVREVDGSKALAKTLDNVLFQRSMLFLGHPEASNYTMQVDVKSDGNRRLMSDVGVVHQRYIVTLKGTWQQIEISSNHERVKESVPFTWSAGSWYTLKTDVTTASDGSATVRAKAWPRGEAEPDEWNIEYTQPLGQQNGSPGIFGFSPQAKHKVYVDNIRITPNP